MEQKTKSRFFSVMVIGENPQEILSKYDMNKKVELHAKYKYLDAKKMHSAALKMLSTILDDPKKIGLTEFQLEYFRNRYKAIKSLSPFEYYMSVTEGMYYDENGDAMTDENPEGKWVTATIGKNFSLPLILLDGSACYQARAGEINWEAMNSDETVYVIAWETVIDGREPQTDEEKRIYEAMKDSTEYLSKFASKEAYVRYCTSFWCYAVVDENGWTDIDGAGNDAEWISNFADRFGKPLEPDQLVSIFECSVNDDNKVSDAD